MRVNWGSVNGASWYNVYRSPIPHDSFSLVASGVPGLTYFDNPQAVFNLNILRNPWYYSVTTVNSAGEGAMSSPSTFLPYGQLIQSNTPRPGLSYWALLF
jgi:hypothetical protein